MRPKDFVVYGTVMFFLVNVARCSRGRIPCDHLRRNTRTTHNGSECFMLGCGPPISTTTNATTDSGNYRLASNFFSLDSRKLNTASIWGYSVVACLLVSAVGLIAVAIIPLMNKVLFNHLLQFLVALAIGSLAGDVLLHLLPHALIPHDHNHEHEHDSKNSSVHEGNHNDVRDEEIRRNAIWLGMTALGGIFLFFVVERSIGLYSEWWHIHKSNEEKPNALAASSEIDSVNTNQMVVPMKSVARESRHETPHSCNEKLVVVHSSKGVQKFADDARDEMHRNCDHDMMESSMSWDNRRNVRGHEHSHAMPGTVSSVAWMVIIGDGFHNFADGLAIGSSFSTGFSDGLGTSIAVFCHEVPHELGDFAMLLNAGMSAKQALVYNSVSCVLCFIGMACGISMGNVVVSRQWIFAAIAGMFLYIALVDMLPEMRSVDPKKGENPLIHLVLQLAGMLTGILVMLLIALFEGQINVV